jgi:hypothetical protein
VLNIVPPIPESVEYFATRYWEGTAPRVMPGQDWSIPETISEEERRTMFAAVTASHLRRFVDEWLETSGQPDGSESSEDRRIEAAPHAFAAFLELGAKVRRPQPSDFSLGCAEPVRWAPSFFEAALLEAKRLLFRAVCSEWAERLCKCRYKSCGRYFLNGNRFWEYRHGTFCSREHQNLGSAAAATSARRTRVHDKLIDLASKQLATWRIDGPHWQDDAKLKLRLAAELSHRISEDPNLHIYRQGATVNWVTRNQLEIEQKRLE